jgi:hypothetical protein
MLHAILTIAAVVLGGIGLYLIYVFIGYSVAIFRGSYDCLPLHLRHERHKDRLWPKSMMSRKWTARCLVEPPIMLWGSKDHGVAPALNGKMGPRPIPRAGQWQFSLAQVSKDSMFFLPYFACNVRGLHFRIGTRWDHQDHYFTLDSLALKFRKPEHND